MTSAIIKKNIVAIGWAADAWNSAEKAMEERREVTTLNALARALIAAYADGHITFAQPDPTPAGREGKGKTLRLYEDILDRAEKRLKDTGDAPSLSALFAHLMRAYAQGTITFTVTGQVRPRT